MFLTNIKTNGNAVTEATVNDVQATDTLQAEYRAEKFLASVAKENGEVVSCDRWEFVECIGTTYIIKFTCS